MTAASIFRFSPRVKALMRKKLAHVTDAGNLVTLFYANGVPTNDTDLANANGDLCWDGESDDIYVATIVAATTTTWTKQID